MGTGRRRGGRRARGCSTTAPERSSSSPTCREPWRGAAVTDPLRAALGVPASIINDARAFTLAESRLGAAAGCDDGRRASSSAPASAAASSSTAGCTSGRMGRAGELAHQVIVARRAAVRVRQPRAASRRSPPPGAIARLAGTADGRTRRSPRAGARRRAGRCGRSPRSPTTSGIAIANIVTVLVPERVVIGGGVAEAGDALLVPVARGDRPPLRARPARLVRDRARRARPARRGDRRRPVGSITATPAPVIWGSPCQTSTRIFARRSECTDFPRWGASGGGACGRRR